MFLYSQCSCSASWSWFRLGRGRRLGGLISQCVSVCVAPELLMGSCLTWCHLTTEDTEGAACPFTTYSLAPSRGADFDRHLMLAITAGGPDVSDSMKRLMGY